MSRFTDIAGAIKTAMDGVGGLGVVHARQRWTNNWSDYLDVADGTVPADGVLFWMIRRESIRAEAGDREAQVVETHRMVIAGAMALDDSASTYSTFQGHVESIQAALDQKRDLGLAYVIDYGVGPCVPREIGEEMVGGVLCHVAEIEVSVIALRDLTYS